MLNNNTDQIILLNLSIIIKASETLGNSQALTGIGASQGPMSDGLSRQLWKHSGQPCRGEGNKNYYLVGDQASN